MPSKDLVERKPLRPSGKVVKAERVLAVLKGPWRMWQYILVELTNFSQAWSMFGNTFMGAEPSHHCRIPEGYNVNESIPSVEKDREFIVDKCQVYKNYSYLTNQTMPCPDGWEYGKDMYSFAQTWDLVCDKDYLPATVQTLLVAGVACGAFITTIVSDKFGRKTVLTFSMVATTVIGCITATVNNFYIFLVLRFLTGAFQQGMVMTQFVYICELFPARIRIIAITIGGIAWNTAACLVPLLAYLFPNWRHLLLAMSIPSIVGIPYYWLVNESPSWLVAKRKYGDVIQLVKACSKWDKNQTEEETRAIEELLKDLSTAEAMWKESKGNTDTCPQNTDEDIEKSVNYSVFDILKSKKLLLYCTINLCLWCITTLVNYGLIYTSVGWVSNRYLGFFLSAIVGLPGILVGLVAFQCFGRRWPNIFFYLLAGGGIFIALAIPKTTSSGTNLSALIITFSMLAKLGSDKTFTGIFIWVPEMYPTTIRNFGLGLASVGGRIGNMCAPLSAYLAVKNPLLVGVIFGSLSIVAAGLAFLLPETHRRPLPHTITEMEAWSRTLSKLEKEALKKKNPLLTNHMTNDNRIGVSSDKEDNDL